MNDEMPTVDIGGREMDIRTLSKVRGCIKSEMGTIKVMMKNWERMSEDEKRMLGIDDTHIQAKEDMQTLREALGIVNGALEDVEDEVGHERMRRLLV